MTGPNPDQNPDPDALQIAEELHSLYRRGLFPMAEACVPRARLLWFDPDPRALLPIREADGLHVPRSLRRTIRQDRYRVTTDLAFDSVVELCANPSRPGGWIDDQVRVIATLLHRTGHAHSVEAWDDQGRLVGGVYGVSVPGSGGPVFCAESMATDFQHGPDAGKVCLVRLTDHLCAHGYAACDVQLANPHTERFGAREIPRREYHALLDPKAGGRPCRWGPIDA